MGYYWEVCDKTIEMKTTINHPSSLTHNKLANCKHIKHTIENPDFFAIGLKFNEVITNYNKKCDFYLINCDFKDFKLVFANEFYPHIKSDLKTPHFLPLKRFLLLSIDIFIETGQRFSHFDKTNITTIRNKRYMDHDFYLKLPMHMVELKMNMIIDGNPHLIDTLNKRVNQSLYRNFDHFPSN